jgi:hypothetical protein
MTAACRESVGSFIECQNIVTRQFFPRDRSQRHHVRVKQNSRNRNCSIVLWSLHSTITSCWILNVEQPHHGATEPSLA